MTPPPSLARLAIPTSVTLANAACGFGAVYCLAASADPHRLQWAASLMVVAWCLDMVDGLVAKLAKATSAFGAELDSLADAVSFGVPAALLVAMAAGPWGAVAGGIYLLALLVRLARFNVTDPGDHLDFIGVPSPGAAMAIAAIALHAGALADGHWSWAWLDAASRQMLASGLLAALPFVALALAGLMVAPWRYPDLPKHYLRGLKPRFHVAALVAIALVFGPAWSLALLFLPYPLLGPLWAAARQPRRAAPLPEAS